MLLSSLLFLSASLSHYGAGAHPAPNGHALTSSTDLNWSASDLLNKAIDAIGGSKALSSVNGLTYHAPNVYRSQTLTQSYNLKHSDQSVASSGSQNMSFNFATTHLQQHVDRFYHYSNYWIWAFPNLQPPIDYSLVLPDGPDSWACFTKGQNSFFAEDPTAAQGYADADLTDYLISTAQRFAIPGLLTQFNKNSTGLNAFSVTCPITNLTFPAIGNSLLGITLILNSTSYLPYVVRTYEDHAIFGNSTNDLLLSEYSAVELEADMKITLPHRFQTLYNSADVLEDFLVESITINPKLPEGLFSVPPNFNSISPKTKPRPCVEYGTAEVHEFYETGLWSGPFDFNTSDVVATHPLPGIPQIQSVYIGYPDYVQLVVEFGDGVLVTDAPPHRSKILIKWVAEKLGKSVKYVASSHHHHDHAYGVGDYVKAGAILVVPDTAVDFYRKVNNGNVSVARFNETNPFVLRDSNVQFRAVWHDEPPHAKDWTYSLATAACPAETDGVVVFNADVWSPGSNGLRFDTGYARQWLDAAVQDGLPRDAVVVGAHGSTANGTVDVLDSLLEITGFACPRLTPKDWKAGGVFC